MNTRKDIVETLLSLRKECENIRVEILSLLSEISENDSVVYGDRGLGELVERVRKWTEGTPSSKSSLDSFIKESEGILKDIEKLLAESEQRISDLNAERKRLLESVEEWSKRYEDIQRKRRER